MVRIVLKLVVGGLCLTRCFSRILEEESCGAIHKAEKMLYFTGENPMTALEGAESTYVLELNGAALVVSESGFVLAAGNFAKISSEWIDCEIIDHGNLTLMPGFIDTHVHASQEAIMDSYGASLPTWLNSFVYPNEAVCANATNCLPQMLEFVEQLLRVGTTTFMAYSAQYESAARSLFQAAQQYGVRAMAGFTGGDRTNDKGGWAPDEAATPLADWINGSKRLIEEFHGKDRLSYVITPRFAPSASEDMLNASKELFESTECAHTCYIQTHMSENYDEIAFVVAAAFPSIQPSSYLDLYDHFGLITNRTILGHSIHLSSADLKRMAETGAISSHCPTSNDFLGSGLWNLGAHIYSNVRIAIGSDIGGGDDNCMLRVLNAAYKVSSLMKYYTAVIGGPNGEHFPQSYTSNPVLIGPDTYESYTVPLPEHGVPANNLTLSAQAGLWLITRGNAEALSLADKIGSFDAGTEADFILIDDQVSLQQKWRMTQGVQGLTDAEDIFWNQAFALMMMGRDDNIIEVWVKGKQLISKSSRRVSVSK